MHYLFNAYYVPSIMQKNKCLIILLSMIIIFNGMDYFTGTIQTFY